MKKIFKYQIPVVDTQILRLSMGYQILSAGFQDHNLCIWAMVMPDSMWMSSVEVLIIGTGNPVPDNINTYSFLNTVHDPRGFVWHIFYKILP